MRTLINRDLRACSMNNALLNVKLSIATIFLLTMERDTKRSR